MPAQSVRVQLAPLILGVILLLTGVGAAAEDAYRAAPNVELHTTKGGRVRLGDFKGKVVLVKFWASWCPQCVEAFALLDSLDREYRSRGVEVLAVNVDEQRKTADAFLKARTYQVRVMFDPRARAIGAFEAEGVPVAYLIDRRGIVRYAHEGENDHDPAHYRAELNALLAESSR
jgi:peroxiredoxin